jgi:hypothetical protein
MAVDKGIMRKALIRARRLNKKKGWFTERELGIYHGGIVRLRRYELIEKCEDGRGFRLIDANKDPVLEYKRIVNERKHRPRRRLLAAAKEIPHVPKQGPNVRVMPYGEEGYYLIQVGKRSYYGPEVAITPLTRRLKRGEVTE